MHISRNVTLELDVSLYSSCKKKLRKKGCALPCLLTIMGPTCYQSVRDVAERFHNVTLEYVLERLSMRRRQLSRP